MYAEDEVSVYVYDLDLYPTGLLTLELFEQFGFSWNPIIYPISYDKEKLFACSSLYGYGV